MSEQILWVMDSDICDECGGLLGEFGICIDCGWDGIHENEWEQWEDEEEDDWYPGWGDDWDCPTEEVNKP